MKKQKKSKRAAGAGPIAVAAERFVGGTSLTTLFKEAAGWFVGKKGKFRRALIAQLGGKTQYQEVSATHVRVPFGGHRRSAGAPAIVIDDAGVKRLRKIRWAKSDAIHAHIVARYRAIKERLATDHQLPERNRVALRDTMRSMRADVKADRGGCWRVERLYEPVIVDVKTDDGRGKMIWQKLKATVYVSPKNNRYVEARANEKATLILDLGHELKPELRLRRFEGSGVERRAKDEEKQIERGKASLKRKRTARREKKLARKKATSKRS